MDKNWRPDDWENPEKDALQGPAILNDVERACLTIGSHAYERGADAMLKARDAYLASQVGPCPEDTCEAMRVFGYCEKECHKCAQWRGQQAGLAQGYEKGYIEGTKDGLELSKACEASVYKQGQKDLANWLIQQDVGLVDFGSAAANLLREKGLT